MYRYISIPKFFDTFTSLLQTSHHAKPLYCSWNHIFLHAPVLKTSCTPTSYVYKCQRLVGCPKYGTLCCLVSRRVLTNMFHETRCISARSCATDFVLVLFGRYWTILHARFGFIPIDSAVYSYKDFSHYFWDNLCIWMCLWEHQLKHWRIEMSVQLTCYMLERTAQYFCNNPPTANSSQKSYEKNCQKVSFFVLQNHSPVRSKILQKRVSKACTWQIVFKWVISRIFQKSNSLSYKMVLKRSQSTTFQKWVSFSCKWFFSN